MLRFCEDNFVGEMESTIGVDFYLNEIDVDGKKIKVSLSFILPNGYHLAYVYLLVCVCRSRFGTRLDQKSTCQYLLFTIERRTESY